MIAGMKHCLLFLIIIVLSSCMFDDSSKNKDKEVLNVTKSRKEESIKDYSYYKIDLTAAVTENISNLSEVATDIEYIPLETSDISRIGAYSGIKVNDRFIVVKSASDNNECKLFFFNRYGKFLFKLDKIGKGYDEYDQLFSFDINFDGTVLAIFALKSIVLYQINNNRLTFIKRIYITQEVGTLDFIDSNNNMLLQFSNIDGNNDFNREIINLNGDVLMRKRNPYKFEEKEGIKATRAGEIVSYEFNKKLYVKVLQSDTLFRITNDFALQPYLILDTKDKRVTPEIRANGKTFLKNENKYIFLANVLESPGYNYFVFTYNKKINRLFFEKSSQRLYEVGSSEGLSDDISGGPGFKPIVCFNGDFLSIIYAIDLKKYLSGEQFRNSKAIITEKKTTLEKLSKKIGDKDNPIVIIAKMK